ncbi:hypothetical protein NHX12_003489 [Muraenolepis orangiensis]|uniref:Uncharacterized protein n=1 Tax=Muraenolepis orangiensis TaxID=630683 RepID=A0A9Q0DZ52_9TELE|nr:hypothetical protein NHX12_003489 [Muraenolepis orangiensis]
MVENRSWVLREGVYRWFSSLTSARRTEFLCGLLDLCVPIELRFLGSCLEDLARKDYNSLRDAEIKANNPADLSGLTNITDEVVRSKLLVSLALLGSDNREAAGVLYRTLTHIDTVLNNYGLPLDGGQTEEQFLLLFTMASNHPAFSFHQKQLLRHELRQIQDILQKQTREVSSTPATPGTGRGDRAGGGPDPEPPSEPSPPPPSSGPESDGAPPAKSHQGKAGRVEIERVEVRGRGLTHTADDPGEYTFEAHWSDGYVSSVLADAFPEEGLDKLAPPSLEPDPRCLTALSSHVLQHRCVHFFLTPKLGSLLQYRGANR